MKEILLGIMAFLAGVFVVFASFAGLLLVLGLLWAIPTMLSTITIWQAWGLNILAGIFFKSKSKTKETDKKTGKKNVILG
jgi:ABC-type antimicrobial peptide transport system permease subunit